MAYDESKITFAEDPTIQNTWCVACGNAAEIHLSLLRGASHPGGNFCFSCGEAVIRDWRAQRAEQAEGQLVHAAHENGEHGIIFWEGHGWSSDGPFAGA